MEPSVSPSSIRLGAKRLRRVFAWRKGFWPNGALILGAVAMMILVFGVILPLWEKQKSVIAAKLSERLGMRIEFTGLGLGLLNGDLHVKGVTIKKGGLQLNVRDLVIHLSPSELIRTRDFQKSLREISLDAPVLSFQTPEAAPVTSNLGAFTNAWPWSMDSLESFLRVNSQVVYILKNGEIHIPGDKLRIPSLVAGFEYLGPGEVRYGIHLTYLEKDIHVNGSLGRGLQDLAGRLTVMKDQIAVDAFSVQGSLSVQGMELRARSEIRRMNLFWNYEPWKKKQQFAYRHEDVSLGYFLSWLGWESLIREERLRYLVNQAHLSVLGDKTRTSVRVDYTRSDHDGKSGSLFSTDFRLKDPKNGESAVWSLQNRGGQPARWNGSYFGNGGSLRAWGLQDPKTSRMNGSIDLENFLFGQIPLSARLTFQALSNGSEWTLYHAPDSGEGALKKSLTARMTRNSNGALEIQVPRSPAGLEMFLAMSGDGKKIEKFESKMNQFRLRIPADFLGLPFLRDGMVSGGLRLLRDNKGVARLESTVELSHAVTQEKWLRSRLALVNRRLAIEELSLLLGGETLLLQGGADFAASDGELKIAYQYGLSKGIYRGRIRNQDGTFSVVLDHQEGIEKASLLYREAAKTLEVSLTGLRFGNAGVLSANGLWSVAGGIKGKGSIQAGGINPWDPLGKVRAEYDVVYPAIELTKVEYQDGENTLNGFGKIRLGNKTVYELNIGDLQNKTLVALTGEMSGQENRATLTVHNLDPNRYASPVRGFLKGRLRILATLTGSLKDPHLTIRGFLDDFRIRGKSATVFSEITKVGPEWEIRRLEVTRQGKNGRDNLLQVNRGRFREGRLEVDLQLVDYPLLWNTRGNFFFTYDQKEQRGFIQSPEYSLDGKPQKLFHTAFERVSEKPGTVQWLFRTPTHNGVSGFITEKTANPIKGDGKKEKIPRTYFVKLGYDKDRTNFARVEGSLASEKLDLIFMTDHFRVSQLNALAPIVLAEESKGETFQLDHRGKTISGVNMFLALSGSAAKPLINGRLLASGKIRLIGQGGRAENFRALVDVEDNVFRFKEAILKFDNGSQFVLEGSVAARALRSVDEFDLHLLSRGAAGIPVAYESSFFETRGRAQLDLVLSGTMFYPKVSGKIRLQENEVNFEKKGNAASLTWEEKRLNFFNRIEWDVQMEAGAKNRLNSAIFELNLDPSSRIRLTGNLYNDTYSLSGVVISRGGVYTHSGVDFRVKNIALTFPKGESGANPFVDMEAVSKVRDGEHKENVEIILEKKSRLFDLQAVSLRAAPPRKPEEIRALLGFTDGTPTKDSTDVNKAVAVSSRLVANTLFFRPLERTIRRSLNIDYFHIDTDILALANQVNAGSSNYVPQTFNTTVSFGKYLGENFFIQSDLSLGLGGQTNTFGGSIGLEYDLKLFNLGGKFQVIDFSRLRPGENPFDLSVQLNKNWSF